MEAGKVCFFHMNNKSKRFIKWSKAEMSYEDLELFSAIVCGWAPEFLQLQSHWMIKLKLPDKRSHNKNNSSVLQIIKPCALSSYLQKKWRKKRTEEGREKEGVRNKYMRSQWWESYQCTCRRMFLVLLSSLYSKMTTMLSRSFAVLFF